MKNLCCFLAIAFILAGVPVAGQDYSNKGTDFWLGYGYHINMGSGVAANQLNAQDMVLYFTSDKNANVVVSVPGVGYTQSYTVTANQVTISSPLPKTGSQDCRINSVGVFDRGIHITSDVPIVAYAHIYNASVSGASLLFPTNTLGKDYYSVNFTQSSNATFANSFFFVVATEDNTTVEITPSATTVNGLPVGSATLVQLNKGQIYSVMGTLSGTVGSDLTGSRIRSIGSNGSGGCKKIAVFSGSGKISIGGTANGSADNLFAQAFPAVAWGKKYLTAPTGSQPNNFYRVCVTDPTTVVKLNGTVLSTAALNKGFYYQFKNGNGPGANAPVPNMIEADKPVLVAQYCTTQGEEGNSNNSPGGDPEMIYLSPVEQTIKNITLYSATKNLILQSYINVIVKNTGVAGFTLDGAPVSGFQPHPQDTSYSYVILKVAAGSHTLSSDVGFNAIAYGFGSAESYGYNAGTNVIDFSPTTTFQNPYGRIDSAVTCANTPVKFSVPLSFTPATIQWDFSAAPNISPSAGIGPSGNVSADSSKTVSGTAVNYYSPGTTFTFSKANVSSAARDTVKLYTTSSAPDGCGSTAQTFLIPVTVKEKPSASFSISTSGCFSDTVHFAGTTSSPITQWLWDFGDGTGQTRASGDTFGVKYAAPGTDTVKLKVISDIGCISDVTSQVLSISSKPVAKFTFSSITCPKTDITFKDASTSSLGPIVKWTWNLDDANPDVVNTTSASVKTQYAAGGVKNPRLLVETATGCKSDTFTTQLTVNPLPLPGFILPEVCLSDANATFTDTSTIASGTISSYLWNFNAGSPAVTPGPNITGSTAKNPQVKYNKSDNYKVSLTVTSSAGCTATQTSDFTVNGSIPKSVFEFANAAPYCGVKPVLLKNKSTVDFGNVTRIEIYWDYGNNPTAKETDENPAFNKVYLHSYADPSAPVSYTVKLVAYSGGAACSDGSVQTITVYPQPKASFTATADSACYGDVVGFFDKSYTGSSAASAWYWTLGGSDVSPAQNPKKQFNDSGTQVISFHFVNADGCISDTASKQLIVYPNPKLFLEHRTQVLEGGQATLKPDSAFGHNLTYLWTPATYLSSDTSSSPVVMPLADITYRLTLTAQGGCTVSDTIFVRLLKGLVIPNAFSPNGDGINDTWKIQYLDGYPGASVEVYNRYGQIVFRSTGYSVEWNGTMNGSPLPVGTYYYIINPRNGKPALSGSVTIIK